MLSGARIRRVFCFMFSFLRLGSVPSELKNLRLLLLDLRFNKLTGEWYSLEQLPPRCVSDICSVCNWHNYIHRRQGLPLISGLLRPFPGMTAGLDGACFRARRFNCAHTIYSRIKSAGGTFTTVRIRIVRFSMPGLSHLCRLSCRFTSLVEPNLATALRATLLAVCFIRT